MSYPDFVKAIGGKRRLSSLVGTTLSLDGLKPGGIDGAEGYVVDPRMSMLFTCHVEAKGFAGGRVTAKVVSIRSTDSGVFVALDRCG